MLELRATGRLELHDGDGSLASLLTQPKRAALFAYLALARPRGFHRRDTLLVLFWPELDDAHARNALSQALTFLRRELPDGVLASRGSDEVGVDPGGVTCDVVAFEDAAEAGRWEEALELYRGELLAGLHVADAPGFERWLDAERDRLRELAAGAAWSLADERLAAGEPVAAERAAQRALLLSPTDESPVRCFIEALARAGDRAAALRFYGKFAGLLAAELEVEPAAETAAVAEAVRRGEVAAEPAAVAATGAAHRDEQGHRDANAHRSAHVFRDERGAPRTPEEPPGSEGSHPRNSGRRLIGGRRLAVALAALVVLVVAGDVVATRWLEGRRTGGPGSLIGEGMAAPYDRVVVADLSAPFDPGLGRAAAEWLRAELDQSDIIRPVDPAAIGAAVRRMERDPSLPLDAVTAREIAVRDGYPLVVVGELADVGESFLATVRLESAQGEVLGRFTGASAGADNLVGALDRMGGEIRARIGESRQAIRRNPPLEQVTTGSLDALRLYTDATRVRDWEGRQADAVWLLERALDYDSTFATAARKLDITLGNLGLDPDLREKARQLAYAHRDRLSEFERLEVENTHAFHESAPDADECARYSPGYRNIEAYIRRHPRDPRPLANYGFYASRLGRFGDAITAYERARSLGAQTSIIFNNLTYAYLAMGDTAGVWSTLEAWTQQVPDSPTRVGVLGDVLYQTGDLSGADSLYASWQGNLPPDPHVRRAQLDALAGRFRAAMEHYADAVREIRRSGVPASSNTAVDLTLLQLHTTLGATATDAALPSTPAQPASARPWVWMNVALYAAAAGDTETARAAWDTLDAIGASRSWLVAGPTRAMVAAASGAPDGLERLRTAESGCTMIEFDYRSFPLMRGRAHEIAGRLDAAIAEYETWLDRGRHLRWDAVFRFDTLERLARLHDQLGHDDEAAAYYVRAADLWADADPELQPRVRALRTRAERLTGEDRAAGRAPAP